MADGESDEEIERPARNRSPPPEIEDNLRSDAIGDTAYSKRWLVALLMDLMKKAEAFSEKEDDPNEVEITELDSVLEEELCKLWDITADEEVAKCLQELKAVDIFVSVLLKSKAPRANEIFVGIMANLACFEVVANEISQSALLHDVVLTLFENEDPPTLLETCRFLRSLLLHEESKSIWLETLENDVNFLDKLAFILQSSTKGDLLKKVIEIIIAIFYSSDKLCLEASNPEFVRVVCEAANQLSELEESARYLSIFEILSTNEKGVAALLSNSKQIFAIIDQISDDDSECLDDGTSAISSVSVLYALNNEPTRFWDEIGVTTLRYIIKLDHQIAEAKGVSEVSASDVARLSELVEQLIESMFTFDEWASTSLPAKVASLEKDYLQLLGSSLKRYNKVQVIQQWKVQFPDLFRGIRIESNGELTFDL